MSCAFTNREGRVATLGRGQPRGLTFIELLVAVLIVAAVMGSAIVAFVFLVRGSEEMRYRLEAINNGRHALDQLASDLMQASYGPTSAVPPHFFIGASVTQAVGNGKDDDNDGETDEEIFNGLDDDNDWTSADDRHAEISTTQTERAAFVGIPDWGDAHVDEDLKFSLTDLRFRIPGAGGYYSIHYYVGTFDGSPNVLIREVSTTTGTLASPVAFNVLSFGTLYWDSSTTSPTPWKTSWDSTVVGPDAPALPKSVALQLTVYAGRAPLTSAVLGAPLETVSLTTVVNIQQSLVNSTFVTTNNPDKDLKNSSIEGQRPAAAVRRRP